MPPTVWPYMANAADTIIEQYGYDTSILPAYRGKEQRIKRKRQPVGSLEFSFLFDSLLDAQRATGLVFKNKASAWAVPLWHYAARLTNDALFNLAVIDVVTQDVPFQDATGSGAYVLLWQSSDDFELCDLSVVSATQLHLAAPLVGSWTKDRTYVIPIRLGHMDSPFSVAWETPQVLHGRVRFEFVSWI